MESFGQYLRAARIDAGFTAARLAAECHRLNPRISGISRVAITLWEGERGKRVTSMAQFDLLAEALNLSAEARIRALTLARARVEAAAA